MRNNVCSNCSEKLQSILFTAHDYTFYQCSNCTLIQLRPFPNKKNNVAFYSYTDPNKHAEMKNPQINFLHRLIFGKKLLRLYIDLCYQSRYQRIRSLHQKGRILDIGCGEGSFLKKFPSSKWQRTGIEINKNLANIAHRTVKYSKIITIPIEIAKLPKQGFEIITMWHVFEHISNPKVVLKSLNKLINPHGYLVIEVPHGNSLYRKLFSRHWQLLLLPQHIYFWTKESITLALNNAGFRVIKISYSGIFTFSGPSSLANLLRSKGLLNFASIVIACIFFPASILINLFFYAYRDNIIIIAQKSNQIHPPRDPD